MGNLGAKSAVIYKNTVSHEELISIASIFPEGGRFCIHDHGSLDLQLMVINMKPHAYYKTHRHIDRDEFYILVSGRLLLTIYDTIGSRLDVQNQVVMSADNGFDLRTYRMKMGTWHSVSSGPDGAVFIEAKGGSWDTRTTELSRDCLDL